MQKTLSIICISILLISFKASAQNDSTKTGKYGRLSAKIAIGNNVVGFPFQNEFSAFNPALAALGIEVKLNKSQRHSLSVPISTMLIKNDNMGHSIALTTDLLYRYTHKSGIFSDLSIGAGILKQYHPRKIYEYNPSTGDYDKAKDHGKTSGLIEFGISLGYDLSRKHKLPVSIYLRNNFFIQTSYFDYTPFSIMPNNLLQLGVNVKLKQLNEMKFPCCHKK